MASSIENIDHAMAAVNKGTDKKEEMRMMLAPYANWDRFLTPAPMTIALLGQLILVSAESDFSLQDEKKEIKFKLLQYPDSFRACLVQVSNKGWKAFNLAHTNMDQIRLYSSNVDGHVRTAVKFLLKGTAREVELMLPKALNSIENIADECLVLASSVEKEFIEVMELVGELLEACTRAKGQYEDELKKTQIAIEVLEANKESVKKRQEEAERLQKETMEQVKAAEREYKDAMDKVPSTGDILGLAVADVVINIGKSLCNVVPNMGSGKKKSKKSKKQGAGSDASSSEKSESLQEIFNLVSFIQLETASIVSLTHGDQGNGESQPKWEAIAENNGAEKSRLKLRDLLQKMSCPAPEIEAKMKAVCADGMAICERLLSLQKVFTRDPAEVEEVVSRAEKLGKDIESVSAGIQMALGANSLPNKSPHQARQKAEGQGDGGLVQSAIQNAQFKTQAAKENLTDSRNRYEKSCHEFDERMKEMGGILAELASQNPKKLDLETIRATLIKGMKALGELREEWGKLVQFFNMLSNLVKCCLESSLKQFVETSKTQMELGVEMSDTMRDVLFEQAFKANQIAYVVNSISGAYTEVSDKHLMDRVTCLGKLISLDAKNDLAEIMAKREELNQGCKQAQEAIKAIANRKKKEIDEAFEKRIGRIQMEVEAVIPPLPKAEIKEIEDQVKTAMSIKKAAMKMENLDDLV